MLRHLITCVLQLTHVRVHEGDAGRAVFPAPQRIRVAAPHAALAGDAALVEHAAAVLQAEEPAHRGRQRQWAAVLSAGGT